MIVKQLKLNKFQKYLITVNNYFISSCFKINIVFAIELRIENQFFYIKIFEKSKCYKKKLAFFNANNFSDKFDR